MGGRVMDGYGVVARRWETGWTHGWERSEEDGWTERWTGRVQTVKIGANWLEANRV